MLIQLHHQLKDESTEFIAQQEIETKADLDKLVDEMGKKHPLPSNAQWMICTEGSHHFIKAKKQ